VVQPDPYASAELFHGPSFQYLTSLATGATGSSAILDVGRGTVPKGCLGQGPLDAGVQAIPHHSLRRWVPEIGDGKVGYPLRVVSLELFEALPDGGEIEVEARSAGFDSGEAGLGPSLATDLQFCVDGRVAAVLRLISVLLPIGSLSTASPFERREFFAHCRVVKGLGLSRTVDGTTELVVGEVDEVDWLRGTVACAWGLPPGSRAGDHPEVIAVKDHVGRLAAVHPSIVEVSEDLRSARVASRPGQRYAVDVVRVSDKVTVRSVDAG
jgi:hypothetical protein